MVKHDNIDEYFISGLRCVINCNNLLQQLQIELDVLVLFLTSVIYFNNLFNNSVSAESDGW